MATASSSCAEVSRGHTAARAFLAAWNILERLGPCALGAELARPVLAGILRLDQGDHDGALACYREALELSRDIRDRRREGVVLNLLGGPLSEQSRMEEAREAFEAATALHRSQGDRKGWGAIPDGLGRPGRPVASAR